MEVKDNEEHMPDSLAPLSGKINQIKATNSVNMTGKKYICRYDLAVSHVIRRVSSYSTWQANIYPTDLLAC